MFALSLATSFLPFLTSQAVAEPIAVSPEPEGDGQVQHVGSTPSTTAKPSSSKPASGKPTNSKPERSKSTDTKPTTKPAQPTKPEQTNQAQSSDSSSKESLHKVSASIQTQQISTKPPETSKPTPHKPAPMPPRAGQPNPSQSDADSPPVKPSTPSQSGSQSPVQPNDPTPPLGGSVDIFAPDGHSTRDTSTPAQPEPGQSTLTGDPNRLPPSSPDDPQVPQGDSEVEIRPSAPLLPPIIRGEQKPPSPHESQDGTVPDDKPDGETGRGSFKPKPKPDTALPDKPGRSDDATPDTEQKPGGSGRLPDELKPNQPDSGIEDIDGGAGPGESKPDDPATPLAPSKPANPEQPEAQSPRAHPNDQQHSETPEQPTPKPAPAPVPAPRPAPSGGSTSRGSSSSGSSSSSSTSSSSSGTAPHRPSPSGSFGAVWERIEQAPTKPQKPTVSQESPSTTLSGTPGELDQPSTPMPAVPHPPISGSSNSLPAPATPIRHPALLALTTTHPGATPPTSLDAGSNPVSALPSSSAHSNGSSINETQAHLAQSRGLPITPDRIANWLDAVNRDLQRREVGQGASHTVWAEESPEKPTLGSKWTIKPGDTAWSIARALWGEDVSWAIMESTWLVLVAWNPELAQALPHSLPEGVTIIIPADIPAPLQV